MLATQVVLGLPSGHFMAGLFTKFMYNCLPFLTTCPTHHRLFDIPIMTIPTYPYKVTSPYILDTTDYDTEPIVRNEMDAI